MIAIVIGPFWLNSAPPLSERPFGCSLHPSGAALSADVLALLTETTANQPQTDFLPVSKKASISFRTFIKHAHSGKTVDKTRF